MRRSLGRCGVESSRMTSSTIKPSLSGSPHTELVDAWALIPDVDPDYDASYRGGAPPAAVQDTRQGRRPWRVVSRCAWISVASANAASAGWGVPAAPQCPGKRRACSSRTEGYTRSKRLSARRCGAPSEKWLCGAHRAARRERMMRDSANGERSGAPCAADRDGASCAGNRRNITAVRSVRRTRIKSNAASRRSKAKARLRKVTQALFGDLAALEAMTLFRRVDASPENTP